eukprot:GHVL01041304.1.p1 GENE.GHVL01041304.1~~GHVL01041304.1.p1  ORF type:complete len:161 (-),score=6.02 GHVL01041304.1:565-1047(-)
MCIGKNDNLSLTNVGNLGRGFLPCTERAQQVKYGTTESCASGSYSASPVFTRLISTLMIHTDVCVSLRLLSCCCCCCCCKQEGEQSTEQKQFLIVYTSTTAIHVIFFFYHVELQMRHTDAFFHLVFLFLDLPLVSCFSNSCQILDVDDLYVVLAFLQFKD